MKLKTFIFVILASFTPAAFAMDAPVDQEVDVNPNTVYPDDVCLNCHTLAQNVPHNKRCLTNCCRSFICADDAQNILKSAETHQQTKNYINHEITSLHLQLTPDQRRKMYKIAKPKGAKSTCLNCNQKLSVDFNEGVFLKTPPEIKPQITLIDIHHKKFELSPELSAALLKCQALLMHEDTLAVNAPIDFSHIKNRTYLSQEFISNIACLIKDPIKETPIMKRSLELFECAKYLAAPDNILYLIANELWPLMQEQADDTPFLKQYKENIKKLAASHLASPLQLSEYIKAYSTDLSNNVYNILPACFSDFFRGNLSAHALSTLKNNGWYQDSNKNWYRVYPFCTLDGLQTFAFSPRGPWISSLNLSSHRIEKVSHNALVDLTEYQNNNKVNVNINLDANPITCIDESFFQELAKRRANGHEVMVSFLGTRLTAQQKEEYKKKFVKATQTLPQKYISNFKCKSLSIGTALISSVAAIAYLAHKKPQLATILSQVSLAGLGVLLGAKCGESLPGIIIKGGLVGGVGLFVAVVWKEANNPEPITLPLYAAGLSGAGVGASYLADYTALALAKRSHPDIKPGEWSADQLVWKNNYKINI